MLYQAYQFQDDLIAPLRNCAASSRSAAEAAFWPVAEALVRQLSAGWR